MRKIFLCILIVGISSCTTTPIQSSVKGQLFGNKEKNLLHQIELIAYHSAMIRDPSMTDEEFYHKLKKYSEDELREMVARKTHEIRRFYNVLRLYMVLVDNDDARIPHLVALKNEVERHIEDLQYAQYLYYSENISFGGTKE